MRKSVRLVGFGLLVALASSPCVLGGRGDGTNPIIVKFTQSRHPQLLSAVNLQNLFDRGAALLASDDSNGGAPDAVINVEFQLIKGRTTIFPDQSDKTFPLAERYDYTLEGYRSVTNELAVGQLLAATFSDVKIIAFHDRFSGKSGVNRLSQKTMILTEEAVDSTTVHEWGHLCGLVHRNDSSENIMYYQDDPARKKINVNERAKMQAYRK